MLVVGSAILLIRQLGYLKETTGYWYYVQATRYRSQIVQVQKDMHRAAILLHLCSILSILPLPPLRIE